LYDEAAARVRFENNRYLGEGVGEYRLGAVASAADGSSGGRHSPLRSTVKP
jgi:hypothetical protein